MFLNRCFLLFVVWFSVGCESIRFLPRPAEVVVWPFGSLIQGRDSGGKLLQGELIAVDSGQYYILAPVGNSTKNVLVRIATDKFSFNKLQYANRSDRMGFAIPILTLGTVSHGFLALVTFPANLLATLIIHGTSKNAYTYRYADIQKTDIRMFARFPQGIPRGVRLAEIQ